MIVNTGKFNFLLCPVDDRIVFFQPIESQEDRIILLPQARVFLNVLQLLLLLLQTWILVCY